MSLLGKVIQNAADSGVNILNNAVKDVDLPPVKTELSISDKVIAAGAAALFCLYLIFGNRKIKL